MNSPKNAERLRPSTHPKETEFKTREINGFKLASSLKAMPAAIKQIVIMVKKTMEVVKAYLKLTDVTAAKQVASAHGAAHARKNLCR